MLEYCSVELNTSLSGPALSLRSLSVACSTPHQTVAENKYIEDLTLVLMFQGSYRQVGVKFKDFSRTSQGYLTVFKTYSL